MAELPAPATDRGVALVTGASRGIGRAIALGLASTGWDVAVNYRSDAAAAAELVDTVAAAGRRAVALAADVTDPAAAARLVAETADRLGPVEVLVNNVGEFAFAPLATTTPQAWRETLESNLGSAFYTSFAALPGMRERRRGRIVNLGLSPVGLVRAAPNVAAYAVAKTGVVVLTMTMAVEEAPYGITVNCVSPGLVDNGHLPPEQADWMVDRVPMGRLGRAEEIADAVLFLVSERASYVSGANLAVAGGWDWLTRPTDHDKGVTGLFLGEGSG
jgi:NAD(P)-dependent dehydrogenase (short-subunit alcohol dehydrogenase family)